jgi:hypothetical protein
MTDAAAVRSRRLLGLAPEESFFAMVAGKQPVVEHK